MLTGKHPNNTISFSRRILSEYSPDIGLGNYIDYEQLKKLIQDTEAAKTEEQRNALGRTFFLQLQKSYRVVLAFVKTADDTALEHLANLKVETKEDVLKSGPEALMEIYKELHRLAAYRELNIAAVRKLLKKFEAHCLATNSTFLQGILKKADTLIAASTLAQPIFDIGAGMDFVASVYGACYGMSLEDSLEKFRLEIRRDLSFRPRIALLLSAHFFREKIPHKETNGSFAIRIMTGNANPKLAKRVCQGMRRDVTAINVSQFPNGEVSVQFDEGPRGDDCYVIQSLAKSDKASLSTMIMELMLMLHAVKQSGCARVSVVIPYFPYTKHTPEAALLAELIVLMGCVHVVTVDMYREQVEGFFGNVPVENLTLKMEFIKYVVVNLRAEGHDFKNLVIVSPDCSAVGRARSFADSLMKYAQLDNTTQHVGVATAVQRVSPS